MKAEHLQLAFGGSKLYDDCSFHFEDTDKVGVVGVNGAGKSTLFKIILGIEKLDEGSIELPGLRLGYLPQEIRINSEADNVTVWDYIAAARPVDDLQEQLNAEYEKLAKYPDSNAIMDRIMKLQDLIDSYDVANMEYELLKIIEKMGLQNLMDMHMKQLSGGQKSKVAFARVLFENAGLLLLDEPTNHLDVETKTFVANYLRNYKGMVLVISHDVEFLDTVTNKTLFLNKTTHKMKAYKGNYTSFRRQYAEEKAEQDRRITEQEREIKRIQEFVERARNAKRSNTALIRQGHVREKMLDKKADAQHQYDDLRRAINRDLPTLEGRVIRDFQAMGWKMAAQESKNVLEKIAEHSLALSSLPMAKHQFDEAVGMTFYGNIIGEMAIRGEEITLVAGALYLGLIDQAMEFAQSHGGGGNTPDSGWGRRPDEDDEAFRARCFLMARMMMRRPGRNQQQSNGLKR